MARTSSSKTGNFELLCLSLSLSPRAILVTLSISSLFLISLITFLTRTHTHTHTHVHTHIASRDEIFIWKIPRIMFGPHRSRRPRAAFMHLFASKWYYYNRLRVVHRERTSCVYILYRLTDFSGSALPRHCHGSLSLPFLSASLFLSFCRLSDSRMRDTTLIFHAVYPLLEHIRHLTFVWINPKAFRYDSSLPAKRIVVA